MSESVQSHFGLVQNESSLEALAGSRRSLLIGSTACKDRAIVRYATVYILLSAFAFNTVCDVLPRLGRGFGPPATDSPDWQGIVTAISKYDLSR